MLFVDATDLNYSAVIAIIAGLANLLIDRRDYGLMNWMKEKKCSKFFGIFNITAGSAALIANWIYQQLSW